MTNQKSHRFCCVLMVIYLAALVYLLFFSNLREITYNSVNLTPFKTIRMLFEYYFIYHQFSFRYWFINIFGNIFLLSPFGFLLPAVLKRKMNVLTIFLSSFFLSLMIELMQYILKAGEADIDDLILNVSGALIGYAVYRIFLSIRAKLK